MYITHARYIEREKNEKTKEQTLLRIRVGFLFAAVNASTHRTDHDLYDLYNLFLLHDLDLPRKADKSPNLRDLGHISWVGSVRHILHNVS